MLCVCAWLITGGSGHRLATAPTTTTTTTTTTQRYRTHTHRYGAVREPLVEALVAAANIGPSDRVVDVGAGLGLVPLQLALTMGCHATVGGVAFGWLIGY
jgi:tRNA A58 N-methylase Trm61